MRHVTGAEYSLCPQRAEKTLAERGSWSHLLRHNSKEDLKGADDSGNLILRRACVTESVIGSLFYGKLIKEVKVGGLKAVIPEVTGRAFVTGIHNFVLDEDDPFKYGFRL